MSRRRLLNRALFDLPPARPVGRAIYAGKRQSQTPAQSTATKFFRNLEQLAAFEGPLRHLAEADQARILVAGCSKGCEAYSLAAFLAEKFPALDWRMDANDISEEALAIAREGRYGVKHGLGEQLAPLPQTLSARLFSTSTDGVWTICEDIAERVTFNHADVLSPDFSCFRNYDIVFGQNFMIHMSEGDAANAFAALTAALRSGGALFAGGMDLDQRPRLVEAHGLEPVNWNIAAIHDADDMRRSAWPWDYWSLEPLNASAPDYLNRYATIFVKP